MSGSETILNIISCNCHDLNNSWEQGELFLSKFFSSYMTFKNKWRYLHHEFENSMRMNAVFLDHLARNLKLNWHKIVHARDIIVILFGSVASV